jgi:hypothetical protein
MLHVTSISPSSSLNSLDLDCHVAREAFRVENIKHAQKKKVQCVAEAYRFRR